MGMQQRSMEIRVVHALETKVGYGLHSYGNQVSYKQRR